MNEAQSPRYPTVLLDLDHTLLDSDASEVAAFAETVASIGLAPEEELFACYRTINHALWQAVERGEITPVELRLTRFEQFVAAIGVDADPEAMATAFTDGLGNNGELYPGARVLLETLAEYHVLGLVTNGLIEVQRARIERLELEPYFTSVIISAEVGTSKPGTEIFDFVFSDLPNAEREATLMVGDSLTSDIQGGVNAGIDTCWYNPHSKAVQTAGSGAPQPTHRIASLDQLPQVAAAGVAPHGLQTAATHSFES